MNLHGFSEALTDDFVAAFDDGVYTGGFARIVASWHLPEGVNGSDPRVVAIVEKCRAAVAAPVGPEGAQT